MVEWINIGKNILNGSFFREFVDQFIDESAFFYNAKAFVFNCSCSSTSSFQHYVKDLYSYSNQVKMFLLILLQFNDFKHTVNRNYSNFNRLKNRLQ